MAGVEDQRVGGRIEDPVQCEREFHHPEVRAQMSAGDGDLVHQELTDLRRQFPQLRYRQPTHVFGRIDPGKHSHLIRSLRIAQLIRPV
ncbi:hypothetical protein CUZ56_03047 [Saezia sanguinis]|uniref:Uncharacterized protein n=1 Tax=Saezia sanguinis TaxID=1965230 RepID=A0A433S9H9_9BURK|nr:hypothetical protein CUZ56_03047 [Saezia sanguinis]